MESPFARYSGQGIQPVTGMAEAGANIGQMYGNAIANFGKSISDGLQRYQENVQKDQILTQEAEALGDQIMAFQNQFRDPTTGQLNPEYAPFAQSLQPHIDKLSKVPSMSLAQKMGTVTGVKAAFANISPQLQAFEMMRNVRLQQDFNKAQAGVREFDTVSVPTAIIPEGKMPYYYNKSYQENEAAFTDLAKQAIAGGANIDLNEAIEKWRNQIKGGTMANNNLPPAIKEGLIKQIDAAKGLEENVQTDESGVTDYGKESEMYDATTTSVKEQLTPKKVEPAKVNETVKSAYAPYIERYKKTIAETEKEIVALEKQKTESESKALLQKPKTGLDKFVQMFKDYGAEQTKERLTDLYDYYKRQGLTSEQIDKLDASEIEFRLKSMLGREAIKTVSPVLGELNALNSGFDVSNVSIPSFINRFVSDSELGKRNLSEVERVQAERWASKKLGQAVPVEERLSEAKKSLLEQQGVLKGMEDSVAGVKPQQQAEQQKPALPEQLAVSNLGAFSLGSRQEQVATTLESKRKDLSAFFMKKYGYVPAGFEQSFKAMYPEAQFKTMETPYGAFMYDGKEWKQIATPTPAKPRSAKEIGEEKSYVFGIQKADGSQDFKEFYPNSGVYMRGIFEGSEKEKQDFRTQMLANARAKGVVGRLIEINDMMGESMPWNAALQGEAEGLLPQIMAALRPEIVGVGTVSNYEQQMIRDVVADPTKFFSLEAKDRAKLLVIATRIDNALLDVPAVYGLEVKMSGQTNAQKEMLLRQQLMGKGKTSREEEYNKTGKINWNR
jgi:hypothetical protein